jgi:hypothetical protein
MNVITLREAGLAQIAICSTAHHISSALRDNKSQEKVGHAKHGQGHQKFVYVVGVQTKSNNRHDSVHTSSLEF